MSAENGLKPLGSRGSAPNPASELTALPRPGREGACCPPRNPTPLSAFSLDFRPSSLARYELCWACPCTAPIRSVSWICIGQSIVHNNQFTDIQILLHYIYRPLTCHTNTLNHGMHVKTPNLSHNSTKLNTLGEYRHLINIHNCTVSIGVGTGGGSLGHDFFV